MTQSNDPRGPLDYQSPSAGGGSAKIILIVLGGLVAVGLVAGGWLLFGSSSKPAAVAPTAPAPAAVPPAPTGYTLPKAAKVIDKADTKAAAADMVARFVEDKDAAGSAYAGKVIDVTGEVFKAPQQDLVRGWFVGLGGGAERFAGVRCYFPPENEPQLQGLEGGMKVTIRGRFEGSDANLVLTDCAILEIVP